jgi:outer membrane biosynthesis protein TonB
MNFIRPTTSSRANCNKTKMKRPILASLLAVFALPSCETAHNAAVTTFRVVDAPAAYVRRKLEVDEGPQTTTTTTTTETTYSDSATSPPQQPYPVQPQPYPPQQPYPPPQPPPVQPQRRIVTEERNRETQTEPEARSTATPRVTRKETPSTAPRTSENSLPSPKSELPYAKPVPGKPGYVFSPYDPNGGYVDVKGYSPGQKVKDPYSGKIFLVP